MLKYKGIVKFSYQPNRILAVVLWPEEHESFLMWGPWMHAGLPWGMSGLVKRVQKTKQVTVNLGISFPTSCVLRVQRGCQGGGVEHVPS